MLEKYKPCILIVNIISLILAIMPINAEGLAAQSHIERPQVNQTDEFRQEQAGIIDVNPNTFSTSSYNYQVGGIPHFSDWPVQNRVAVAAGTLQLIGFDYPDFTSLAGLSLVGVAARHGNRLRLTPSVMYKTGAAWYTARQPVRDGFETTFQFQVTDIVNDGADGFAFVVQDHSGLAMGSGGGSLGYAAIPNSLAIEFDMNQNDVINDPNSNHISVQTRGIEVNDENHDYTIGYTKSIPNFSDGDVHTVTVSYTPGEMRISLDSRTPVLTVPVNLSEILRLDEGYAWVGFTATTGGMWENHDILSWSFVPRMDEAISVSTNGASARSYSPGDEPDYTTLVREFPRSIPPKIDQQRPWYRPLRSSAYDWSPLSGSSFLVPHQPDNLEEAAGHISDSAAAPLVRSPSALPQVAAPAVTFVVTSTADAGPGSLRDAMSRASAGNTIIFDPAVFPPASPTTIALDSPLPDITQGNLTLDASDAGVVLEGRNLSHGHGLRIMSDVNIVKGLKIVSFPNDGIEISNGSQYNHIGGDWTVGEGPHGEGNIITLNGNDGVDIHGTGTMSNTVSGNLIGLDTDGTRDFRVQAIAVSPVYTQDHTVFVGTRYNGVWKTTDGGKTWAAVNSGLTISNVLALAISPNYGSDQTLFVGSERGTVFRSMDGGTSWTQVDAGVVGNGKVQALAISPDYANDAEMFVIDDDRGLFISTDRGDTWENRSAGLSGHEWLLRGMGLSPNYAIDQTIFVFSWDKAFKSTDRGHSWVTVTSGISSTNAIAFSPNYAVDQTVFLGSDHCEPDIRPVLWKSTDAGAHWTPISGTLEMCGVRALQVAPSSPTGRTLFVGGGWNGVYKSTDDGVSWHKVKPGRFNWSLAISPAYAQDRTLFVGRKTGEIFRSADAGNTWIQLGANLTEQGNYDEGVHIWDGAQHNVIGGEGPGQRNVISNNGSRGVVIWGSDTIHNSVIGNYIGTDADGTKPLGNGTEGVVIERKAQRNLLQDNVISGNAMSGISIRYAGTMSNTLIGNYIGVDASGARALGNDEQGVILMQGTQGNRLGGAMLAERNVIADNGGAGIGIWHTGTNQNIVSGNYIGTDATGTLPLGNYQNGVDLGSASELAGPRENRVGGALPGEGNVMSANGGHGVGIGRSHHNTIIGNYIGVDATGTISLSNRCSGMGIYDGSQYNRIGGATSLERNIISGNNWHGIEFWGATTMSNTILGNYIGTNVSGTVALGNRGAGVAMWGAQWNQIGGTTSAERNTISGNGGDGVTLSGVGTIHNTVSGNYIGLDATGTMTMGNANAGVTLGSGAKFNQIGGTTSGERNVVSGNRGHGISIWDPRTQYNDVIGNYIGTDASATIALGNAINGVFLGSGTRYNEIGGSVAGEGNVISGNEGDGIGLWNMDTRYNLVLGNYIGVDVHGANSLRNANVGVTIGDSAQFNRIGGSTAIERNIISGNGIHGVGIWDAGTMSNTVMGNYIGTDATGTKSLRNTGSGVNISNGAQYNQVGGSTSSERNVISGNEGHGISIWEVGTTYNIVIGNYIGTDASGTRPLGNSAAGVGIGSGAQYNRVGGVLPGERNVIGGSYWDGIGLWGTGTMHNTVIGNYIGTDATGTASLRNYGAGVGLRDGVQFNRVGGTKPEEGNLISGNEDAGVWLSNSGTMSNTISNNYIGVTSEGTMTLGNRHGVACLWDAQFNVIEHNIIGGSIYDGIHFDSCDCNVVRGNYIGTDAGETLDLGNSRNGLMLFNDAQQNVIGPSNVIAHNDQRGISVWEPTALYNTATRNATYDNFTAGVVNGNGGNAELSPPTLTHVTTQSVSGLASTNVVTVELFSDRGGQGRIYEGNTAPDAAGVFSFMQTEPFYGPNLTAIAIDTDGNTSEFSNPVPITEPNCLPQSRYEALMEQAINAYPDDLLLRIQTMITSLDVEWGNANGTRGLEWSADEANPRVKNFGYHSIVWTDTGNYIPVPAPVGTWVPEPDFYHVGWGIFHATGRLRMLNSGRSIRICLDTTGMPPTDLSIGGAPTGTVGTNEKFRADVAPMTATAPITYHWSATGHSSLTHIGELYDEAIFYWPTGGRKVVTVTAMNAGGAVTKTMGIMAIEAEPFALTGYAVSLPVTPTRLAAWEVYTLTTDVPLGTSMCASVLDVTMNPLPGLHCVSLADGLNTIELESVDPSVYPCLRLGVFLTSTVFSSSPRLTTWGLAALVRPATPILNPISNPDEDSAYLVDWLDVDGGVSYILQEDDNADFTSPITRYTGDESEYTLKDQAVGVWYYRVKASDAVQDSTWSNTESVMVRPETPLLNAIVNPSANETYTVDWAEVSGANSYTLQEDDNIGFTSPITRYTGSDSRYVVDNQPLGTWYYRVRAREVDGPPSNWSNIAATTVVNGAIVMPSTWVLTGQSLFFLAEVKAGEASLDLYTPTLHIGSQILPLYDDGAGDDFYAGDDLYSARMTLTQTGSLTAALRLGPQILGQQRLDVINAPKLLLLTDWDALYAEFRDTEMPVHADENSNDAHDLFDLVARLQQYTRVHRGVVVDLSQAITTDSSYPMNYADLDYGQDKASRLQMGHLIDQLIADLNIQTYDSFQNVVLLGDDQVVPFYRVYDPTDFYNKFNQNHPQVYQSREIAYPETVGGTQENATLLDSHAAYIMSDVPYGIRAHQVITRGTWLSMLPDLPRWATYPEPEMGVGRIFAAYPYELVEAIERYDTPLHMTPGTARAALFRALDKTETDETIVDFSALAERSLFPEIRDWFGANLQDYDQVARSWEAAQLASALGDYDLVSWWGHTTHQTLHVNSMWAIEHTDVQDVYISKSVAFVGLGCHLGYSVSRHPDGGGPVYPYARGIVNALIPKGVTYFAPSSYAYTWPKAFRSSNLHELFIAQFANHLMDYTAPTVGSVWQKSFHPYHATDPAVVENNNPGTRIFHIAAAYGNVLYGLPTQPIERVRPRGVGISYQHATAQARRRAQDTIVLPNLTVAVPHFAVERLDDGTTLFSVPNDGTHLAPTNGPALPLVIRTLILPDNVRIDDVHLISVQSEPYPQPVTLARPHFETSNGQLITGTYVLPGAYPENLFRHRVVQTDEGQQMILSALPLQYDKQTHKVTLYTQMDFKIMYETRAPVPGPRLTTVNVNDGQPLRVNVEEQPLHIEVTYDRDDNANLMWRVSGPDGFIVTSGNMVLHTIDGTTTVNVPLDTTGWRPGLKDLAVYLVYEGYISDSENISLMVKGLGIDDLDPQHHVYATEDVAATWNLAIRDEDGALVAGLEDAIQVLVDGQVTSAQVTPSEPGEYQVTLSLNDLATGEHLIRVSATDVRSITGWREWTLTRLPAEGSQIYLPLVLKG